MKIAHLDKHGSGTERELIENGRQLEIAKKYKEAEKGYRSLVKRKTPSEQAFNRLMIVLRKQKEYKEELQVIDEAMMAFQKGADKPNNIAQSKIHRLSLSLGRSTGLIDKKGNSTYEPEPIATWKRRRMLLIKRIKSAKNEK